MAHSHYPLQALLYAVALHRYLAVRLGAGVPTRMCTSVGSPTCSCAAWSATPPPACSRGNRRWRSSPASTGCSPVSDRVSATMTLLVPDSVGRARAVDRRRGARRRSRCTPPTRSCASDARRRTAPVAERWCSARRWRCGHRCTGTPASTSPTPRRSSRPSAGPADATARSTPMPRPRPTSARSPGPSRLAGSTPLAASPLGARGRPSRPGARRRRPRPLVLHGSRLYTQRQWIDECAVAAALTAPARRAGAAAPAGRRDATIGSDWPRSTAASGRALTVVVGGPGTGKTHTIARLLRRAARRRRPGARIGLAAPTGKAAARLTASMHGAPPAAATWPHDVAAASAALRGSHAAPPARLAPGSRTRFRHDAAHPLPYDVVVVDETSMVPLPMMARLLEADAGRGPAGAGRRSRPARERRGRRRARRHRAADGDAPDVLCASTASTARQSGRRSPSSPVPIRQGGADDVHRVAARRRRRPDLRRATPTGAAAVREAVLDDLLGGPRAATSGDAAAALAHVGAQRVLCAHRRGPFGVDEWNRTVRGWVARPPLDRPAPGDVLLATRNDPRTGTNNGDTGVLVDRDGALAPPSPRGDRRHRAGPGADRRARGRPTR